METIWVRASLRRALKEDIFTPFNSASPYQSERVKDNILVFRWCPALSQFSGTQVLNSKLKIKDVLIPLNNGSLYVFKEEMDHSHDEYIFHARLEKASGEELKQSSSSLKIGLVYFILLNQGTISGPHFLSEDTVISTLADHLNNNRIYLVSKQQSFREIQNQETA